jgi:hypothetical protein
MAKKKKAGTKVKAEATAKAEIVAKATYQRKRTITQVIPEDVTRATAATWLTIISPLTEWAGLHGDRLRAKRDQLRLQREDVLLEIARRARVQIEAEGGAKSAVPNKFLVPFLEKASLEDSESELRDAWSNLFVEAARNFDPKLQIYADILSRISWREARLLEAICFGSRYHEGVHWPGGHFEDNSKVIAANVGALDRGGEKFSGNEPALIWKKFKEDSQLQYGHLLHATVMSSGVSIFFYNADLIARETNQTLLFDILEHESLVKRTLVPLQSRFGSSSVGSVSYFDLSYLAIDLIKVCTRGFTKPIGKPDLIEGG